METRPFLNSENCVSRLITRRPSEFLLELRWLIAHRVPLGEFVSSEDSAVAIRILDKLEQGGKREREREIIKRDGVDVGNKREADPDDRFDRSTASFGSNLTPTDAARGKRTVRKKGEGGKKEGKRKRDRGWESSEDRCDVRWKDADYALCRASNGVVSSSVSAKCVFSFILLKIRLNFFLLDNR